MSLFRRNTKEANLIIFFTLLKLSLHLLANANYGFHRDEFLYIVLGEHLDWGYKEVSPFIALVAKTSSILFGESVFGYRFIPALFSAGIVFLVGLTTFTMGGKRFAITVACLGAIVSPAFLASGYLFQPVVFDQFFWVLSAYLLVRYIQIKKTSTLYWLGLALGLGVLTKYTMALYAAGLLLGLLISGQRRLLLNKHFIATAIIAILLIAPNFLWQITNDFPELKHLQELKETQLNYVKPLDFILQQCIIHATGILVWLPGLFYLFISRVRGKFMLLSIAYLVTMTMLVILHGKIYYGFGAYPVLFAAGGLAWQRVLNRVPKTFKYAITCIALLPALVFLPIAIPILPFNTALGFFAYFKEKGLDFPLKWEDQKIHATTQDYADMLGWDEIAQHVNKAYQSLDDEERKQTTLFAQNYGQAGAISQLGKQYHLPPVVCLNSSFSIWAPDSIQTQHIIYVHEGVDNLNDVYKSAIKIGEVVNPYAREKGTTIYLLSGPTIDINQRYRTELKEVR
ncbi:phospholipid carrier-dependent glycosyltransferase [Pedobacter sp. HMF7647]|uniref:Phospholipid carrier-dependent glycosyltransferase n=1 Tax=Hufsiella arboris TaxID=2695275 RepID=A0A7K1YFA1_9SPHI|nr:glycosyltransferase family 39 protein [Hufsiella arboris]MXV53287.1 phospholipid carrier-dependent glycosyltransferase [Hufsiella arboris]